MHRSLNKTETTQNLKQNFFASWMQLNKLRNIVNSLIYDNPSIVFFTVFLQLFSVQLDLLFGQFVQLLLGFRVDDAHLQTLPDGVGVFGMADRLEMFGGVFPGILNQDFV
jgi:hypothetical protein